MRHPDGRKLAITPVNLRAIPPGEEEVPEDFGSHPGAFQAHPAAPPASDGPLPAGGFPDGPGHGDASSGYTAGGTIPSAGQQDLHHDRSTYLGPEFQQGDKVMIHGLENKKELNDRFGILLQFDRITQRWGGGADGLWHPVWQTVGHQALQSSGSGLPECTRR